MSEFPGRFSAGQASASCRPFRRVQQRSRVSHHPGLRPGKARPGFAAWREACVNSYLGEGNGLEDTEDRRSAGGHGNQHVCPARRASKLRQVTRDSLPGSMQLAASSRGRLSFSRLLSPSVRPADPSHKTLSSTLSARLAGRTASSWAVRLEAVVRDDESRNRKRAVGGRGLRGDCRHRRVAAARCLCRGV